MSEAPSEAVVDKRALERSYLIDDVSVEDVSTGETLGYLVNIHAEGILVVGAKPLKDDHIYQVRLVLPEPIDGESILYLGVDCLWARNAVKSDSFWSGCKIIDIAPDMKQRIGKLVGRWGISA